MNVRVFNVALPDGTFVYGTKTKDDVESNINIALDLTQLAQQIKKEMGLLSGSIDFFPFHDVECGPNLIIRKCTALSEKDIEKFMEAFRESPS